MNGTQQNGLSGSVACLAETCGQSSKSEFVAQHRSPFLLQLTSSTDDAQACPPADLEFGTISLPPGKVAAHADHDHRLFELKKRGKNPFADMVTVGRAANNDVVIPSPCVSKFHAFFRARPGGWVIVDAGSSNGTHLDGTLLRSATVHILDLARAPIALRFGSIACEIFSPDALWDYLQALFGQHAPAIA